MVAPLCSLSRCYHSFGVAIIGKLERSALSWKYYDILLAYSFFLIQQLPLKSKFLPLFELISLYRSLGRKLFFPPAFHISLNLLVFPKLEIGGHGFLFVPWISGSHI